MKTYFHKSFTLHDSHVTIVCRYEVDSDARIVPHYAVHKRGQLCIIVHNFPQMFGMSYRVQILSRAWYCRAI